MSKLEEISESHSQELEMLNGRIAAQLESSNTLMSQIVMQRLRKKGKQIRPLLLMMCAQLFGDVTDKVVRAAAAVELLHNASLIHDDVVDNSPTRRGQPTVNAVWDNHIAVLVGDFFTSSAMQEAIGTGDIRIIDSLCSLGRKLSLGEIDQIYTAREHSFSEENYYKIIDYKTASLFVAAAEMGCYAADAPADACERMSRFAALFGRCFQIRDDVFDYFAADLVGKPTGNDLREGKMSLPLLHVLAKPGIEGKDEIKALLGKDCLSDAEIARIQEFARANGGIEYAFEVMRTLRAEAVGCLAHLPASAIRTELIELFDFVIDRQF